MLNYYIDKSNLIHVFKVFSQILTPFSMLELFTVFCFASQGDQGPPGPCGPKGIHVRVHILSFRIQACLRVIEMCLICIFFLIRVVEETTVKLLKESKESLVFLEIEQVTLIRLHYADKCIRTHVDIMSNPPVSISRVSQDFLVEMERQDQRYTCDMTQSSLTLLHLQVKCTDVFLGSPRRERTSRSHWKNWTKGEHKHQHDSLKRTMSDAKIS